MDKLCYSIISFEKLFLYLSWCFSWSSCISWVFSWIFTLILNLDWTTLWFLILAWLLILDLSLWHHQNKLGKLCFHIEPLFLEHFAKSYLFWTCFFTLYKTIFLHLFQVHSLRILSNLLFPFSINFTIIFHFLLHYYVLFALRLIGVMCVSCD